ncbi:hypothetical protein PTKIN_Ptkin18bG0106900 [Pterospermum kingtungense]
MHIAVEAYRIGISILGRCENLSTKTYLAAPNMILVLAYATSVSGYHMYKGKQGWQMGLVVDFEWAKANSVKLEDKLAAVRWVEFQLGWLLHPLYFGEYPKSMHERLGDLLPDFTEEAKRLYSNLHFADKVVFQDGWSDTTLKDLVIYFDYYYYY